MSLFSPFRNRVASGCLAATLVALPAAAWADRVDDLLARLQQEELPNWEEVEKEIRREWSRSGSPAMDVLLRRGRESLKAEEPRLAIEHLTALTDHAPEFAEGWHARATAYYSAGLYGPAMRDLEIALRLNPRHFGALTGVGRILEETGRPEDALSAYRAAAIIHPHEPEIAEAIGRLEREVTDDLL